MARLTRRELAILLAAAPLAAQETPAGTTPTPQPISAPGTLDAATAQVRQASESLRALSVPMNIEPAFTFRV